MTLRILHRCDGEAAVVFRVLLRAVHRSIVHSPRDGMAICPLVGPCARTLDPATLRVDLWGAVVIALMDIFVPSAYRFLG